MSSVKRALLIASPFRGLRGPLNDVETMATVLSDHGFEIWKCCDARATRVGILDAWRHIIEISSSRDTIVIYYSGHGGIVEDTPKPRDADVDTSTVPVQEQPWRYQFLVPMDFLPSPHLPTADINADHSFTGILDVELAYLLRATTDRTRNVTTIFDCCYSGRMVRDSSYSDAIPRNLSEVQYAVISRYLARMRAEGQFSADANLEVEGNSSAVRVAAAASTETAWEHSRSGQWGGTMTEALAKALREALSKGSDMREPVSWRTTLQLVRELVNIDFPQQNPHVEGLERRMLFSLEEAATNAFVLHLNPVNNMGMLEAGRLSGVREGNVYALMPLGSERPRDETQIGLGTVTHVVGLKAEAELLLFPGKDCIPKECVKAFLVQEALPKWPIACPQEADALRDAIDESKYLRREQLEQDSSFLARFRRDEQSLVLTNRQGVHLATRRISERDRSTGSWAAACKDLVKQAEQLARAQHLLALTCPDDSEEKLKHDLSVMFGTVTKGKADRVIAQDGSGYVTEGESIYLSLKNDGYKKIYVSVFDINVAGKVTLISTSHARGIELPPQRPYVIGADQFGLGLSGLGPASWPSGISKTQPVNESLVLILTDSPVDLRYLADTATANSRGDAGLSSLERLTLQLATGARRNLPQESRSTRLCYDTLQIPFAMRAPSVEDLSLPPLHEEDTLSKLQSEEVPFAEEMVQGRSFPPRSPYLEEMARGFFGAILRTAKGIPACVWVVNEDNEDILVVVSKYRPNRMVSGAGMNFSSTGAGVDISSTSFVSPACKKLLAARQEGEDDTIGVFPLWTRKEGFGVISIFKGPQKELYIENDRIPLGATAFFSNKPDLRLLDYEGREILSEGHVNNV